MIDVERKPDDEKYTFDELYRIIELLRSPEGCPWDKVQTHDTLKKPMIEEAYEVVDAIDQKSIPKLKEELGDVLLQVIFHSIIGSEEGLFSFDDITDTCARKMIFRHTHVFGDVKVEGSSGALSNWETMKLKEKGITSVTQDLSEIPNVLPALMKAVKAAKKIRKAGLKAEDSDACCPDSNDELGKMLFNICAEAEKKGLDPEFALAEYTDKLKSREWKSEDR